MMKASDILAKVGANIKAVRLERGLQQKEVASMVGVSLSQYGRIENGNSSASIVILVKIANGLDISLDELVFGKHLSTDEEDVVINDKVLAQKMQELDQLTDEEKEVANELIDLLVAKKRFKELMSRFGR